MSGDSSNVKKELPPGYHEKPNSIWQKLPYRSDTGGVSAMSLENFEKYTNHRLYGMSPELRAWRKQWLKDQHLSPREPVEVPELRLRLTNPFRRMFQYPGRQLEKVLKPHVHPIIISELRMSLRWAFRFILIGYISTYYFLYRANTWTHVGGFVYQSNKPILYPGDVGYPFVSEMTSSDYYDMGFKSSPLYKSEEQIRAEYAAELEAKKNENQ